MKKLIFLVSFSFSIFGQVSSYPPASGGGSSGDSPGAPDNSLQFRKNSTTLGGTPAIFDATVLTKAVFSGGSGLNDCSYSGTFTDTAHPGASFYAYISTIGTPDIISWAKCNSPGLVSCGGETVVALTTSSLLSDGVSFGCTSTTGHTAFDEWDENTGIISSYGFILRDQPSASAIGTDSSGQFISVSRDAPGTPDNSIQYRVSATEFGGDAFLSTRQKTISSPTDLAVSVVGTTGTSTYGYKIFVGSVAGFSVPSSEVTTSTGTNGSLSGTDYNHLTWSAVPGAVLYYIIRSSGGSAQGVIAATSSTALNDTGLAILTNTNKVPTQNTTDGHGLNGNLRSSHGDQSLAWIVGSDPFATNVQAPANLDKYLFYHNGPTANINRLFGLRAFSTTAGITALDLDSYGSSTVQGIAMNATARPGATANVVGIYNYTNGTGTGGTNSAILYGGFGAGTVTGALYGFKAEDLNQGAQNYSFHSNLDASGSNNYAFYGAGTAPSHFGGVVDASGGSAGKVVCWKADGKTLGYCSSIVGVAGDCTCN